MPQGHSIHIGLNHIDDDSPAYAGITAPVLTGCINDAKSMDALAASQGFTKRKMLLDDQATADEVLGAVADVAANLQGGDVLLITYAGHGSQVTDRNGDEPDGYDETWVLWDRMLVDDELRQEWSRFRKGVDIVVVSDSCHAATVDRGFYSPQHASSLRKLLDSDKPPLLRGLDAADEAKAEALQLKLYPDTLKLRDIEDDKIDASVLLLAGCQDNQSSMDGAGHGLFTEKLLYAWGAGDPPAGDGTFHGTYEGLLNAIVRLMPPVQTPAFDRAGAQSPAFEAQRPFTI